MSTTVTAGFVSTGDVATVFDILTSDRWPQLKADRLGDGSSVVRREEQPDGGIVLAVSRELPRGAPGFLERFLPRDGRVLQTDTWAAAQDGSRRGTWTVEIPGAPAALSGSMRLEPHPEGSRYTLQGDVKVSVPLIGGKAERFIADLVVKLVDKEAALLTDALAAPGGAGS